MNKSVESLKGVPTHRSAFRGRRVIDAMPVELLLDQRGVYGIGVAQGSDIEAPGPLILRPDCLQQLPRQRRTAALQKILGRHPVFWNTTEEGLRIIIHDEAVKRSPRNGPDSKAWEVEYWRKYYGLLPLSVSLINRLIGQLIEEAADRDAIRAARRFSLYYRESIYRAAASHHRVLQLVDTFPLAALATCADWHPTSWYRDRVERASTAARLVQRGARLREVAAALEIPMAFRRVKPGVAHLVPPFLVQHPDLLQWMPQETPAARIWLLSVDLAHRNGGEDYGRWVARRVSEIPGGLQQVRHTIGDLLDWLRATKGQGNGCQLVTRRFTPSMELRTAMRASHDWHEAVASDIGDADDLALPPSWYPPATHGGFDIVPLTTGADLYREGHAMHHCVATFVDQVRQGTCSVFSVRRDGKRIATVSLICDSESVSIYQLRGPCNAAAPRAVAAAVRQWLRAQRTTVAVIKQKYDEWCATQIKSRQKLVRADPDDYLPF